MTTPETETVQVTFPSCTAMFDTEVEGRTPAEQHAAELHITVRDLITGRASKERARALLARIAATRAAPG